MSLIAPSQGLVTQARHNLREILDPAAISDVGILHTRDDSGDTELFYDDDKDRTTQITKDGGLNVPAVVGNTLDQAYDQGGAGAGRIITADAGAVEIAGAGGLDIAARIQGAGNLTLFGGPAASGNFILLQGDNGNTANAQVRIRSHNSGNLMIFGAQGLSLQNGVAPTQTIPFRSSTAIAALVHWQVQNTNANGAVGFTMAGGSHSARFEVRGVDWTSGGEADTFRVVTLGAPANGAVFGTVGVAPTRFITADTERARFLDNANTLQFNEGGTVEGGALTGNNLTLSSNALADGKILFGTSAYDEVNNRLGLGTNAPNALLDVRGAPGAVVGGFASGALHVTSPSAAINANSVITGHNLFGGNKQLWYLGSVSSSNDNIAFINRQTGSLALQTSNSSVTLLTGSSNTLQGNGGLKLQGGAGIFTLTLSGGTGLASTLKLQEAVTDILSAYGVAGQAQAAKIADPSGGATVDAESRTAINSIIDVLEGIGFSAAA